MSANIVQSEKNIPVLARRSWSDNSSLWDYFSKWTVASFITSKTEAITSSRNTVITSIRAVTLHAAFVAGCLKTLHFFIFVCSRVSDSFFGVLGESISLASWAQPISSSATYPLCLACGIDSGGLTALFSDGPAWAGTRWHFLTVLIRFWFAFQKVDCASSVNLISTHLSIENLNIDLDRPDYFASVRLLVCDGQHFLQR